MSTKKIRETAERLKAAEDAMQFGAENVVEQRKRCWKYINARSRFQQVVGDLLLDPATVLALCDAADRFELAMRYIQESPCDPDIHKDQWNAYKALWDALGQDPAFYPLPNTPEADDE